MAMENDGEYQTFLFLYSKLDDLLLNTDTHNSTYTRIHDYLWSHILVVECRNFTISFLLLYLFTCMIFV